MSADNGIYLLKTPKENSLEFEYRVIHAQAIENIYYDERIPSHYNPEGAPEEVIAYFGECVPMTKDQAIEKAFEMESEILKDDFCPIIEYGIVTIDLPRPFSWYQKEARKYE